MTGVEEVAGNLHPWRTRRKVCAEHRSFNAIRHAAPKYGAEPATQIDDSANKRLFLQKQINALEWFDIEVMGIALVGLLKIETPAAPDNSPAVDTKSPVCELAGG
jgi:hypothetical protein